MQVRAGDDKGKIGRVVKVLRKMNRVVIRGVNVNEYSKSKSFEMQQTKKERRLGPNVHALYIYQTSDSTIPQ